MLCERLDLVSQPFSIEEPLRYIFISRGTPTYENVYRPQKVDSREHKSITARLLSGKYYVKICYIFYIYIFHDFSRNPRRCSVEPQGSWERWLGNTGMEGWRKSTENLSQYSWSLGLDLTS
jgi:hypothetical protein